MLSFLCLISTLAAYVIFRLSAILEERKLIDVFGQDYKDYMKEAPRFIPKIRPLVFPLGMVAALFGSAGRLDLPFVWAYIAVFAVFNLIGHFAIDPSLRKERYQPGPNDRDRFTRWLVLPLLLTHWIIAGLDIGRFHWSDIIPPSVQIMGLIGLVASLGLAMWATKVNTFFSPALRIQKEREHFLITAGPYKHIRHPGYLAGIFSFLFGTLVLGSCWAILPVVGYIILILRRTALEDRFLQQELKGYKEYVQKTPYRLLPGVW